MVSLQQIESDLAAWDAIEDHRTGTLGEAATDAWLSREIQKAGATPEINHYPFQKRTPGSACVTTDRGESINGLPCFDGPGRDATAIVGSAGVLGSSAKIGVCRFAPGGSQALEHSRRDGSHKAIVAISAAEYIEPGLAVQNAEQFRDPFGPPVLQVSSEASDWLLAAAESGRSLSVQIELMATGSTASNVQAAITGTDHTLDPVVIMTPKSAWWTCTAERGGGICAWLSCLRAFASQPPLRSIIFTANSGHELSHLGLDHFTLTNPSLLGNAHVWLHLGANFAARDSQLLWQASDSGWLDRGVRMLAEATGTTIRTTPVGSRPLGEARNVFDAGGRFVSLLGNNRWFHHPADRLERSIDLERTARLCEIVLEVATELANG
jgi:hypothetical protein